MGQPPADVPLGDSGGGEYPGAEETIQADQTPPPDPAETPPIATETPPQDSPPADTEPMDTRTTL